MRTARLSSSLRKIAARALVLLLAGWRLRLRRQPGRRFQDHDLQADWVTLPLGEMYNPVFFIGTAYAVRGDTDVPRQPVSHGYVRIPMDIAGFFHTLVLTPGTPVYIRR